MAERRRDLGLLRAWPRGRLKVYLLRVEAVDRDRTADGEPNQEPGTRRPELRALIMSGYSEQAIHDHDLGEKVAFLQKPFSVASPAGTAREILDR